MIDQIFQIIYKHREGFMNGLSTTFQICLMVWLIGIILGAILGLFSSKYKVIDMSTKTISFVLSGVPILVFLFWLHYPAQNYLNISVDPFYTSVFMLSILNLIAVSEIIKTGINNLPGQYVEVAKICGIKTSKIILKIEFPLIIRHILPSLLITQVNMLHMSLFASLISVEEIFRISQRVISIEYKPVEIYSALGIFFLLISLPINGVALYLKKRFSRNLDEK